MNIIYQIIEPPLSSKEREQRDEIMEILVKSLNANIEDIDADPKVYLRTAMDKVIKAYGMKISKRSKSKLFYYLNRDLIGYGLMDVLMNDPNVEDISLDGTNVPIFAYHRKFESVETTVVWETDEVLEAYVIKLAQRCGKHISVAEPLLDATLMDGSRIVMKLGREVSTRLRLLHPTVQGRPVLPLRHRRIQDHVLADGRLPSGSPSRMRCPCCSSVGQPRGRPPH